LKARIAIALVLLIQLAVGCSGQPANTPRPPVLLRVAGSTSMQPLLRELATAYSKQHKYVSFEFAAVGSDAGLELLRRDKADLALVSRPLRAEEELDLSTGKRALNSTLIAWNGIAVIVNEKNPLRKLSPYQIRNIFEGQILTWEELGGSSEDIVVISREDGSGTRAVFEAQMMNGHRVTPTALVMPGSEAMRNYVATHPTAICYLSQGWLGPGVAAIGIDGVLPSQQSIEQGTYPLTCPFLLVYREDPHPEVASFVAFAGSPAGQVIVRQTYGGASTY